MKGAAALAFLCELTGKEAGVQALERNSCKEMHCLRLLFAVIVLSADYVFYVQQRVGRSVLVRTTDMQCHYLQLVLRKEQVGKSHLRLRE